MLKIPGSKVSLRLFDRVKTEDDQYDIFDVGVQYEDGSIDSVVVGGSFATVKRLASQLDKDAAKKERKKAEKKARKAARKAAEAVISETVEEPTAAAVA